MRRVLSVVILIATSLAIGLGIASSPASALARGFTDVQLVNPPGNPLSSPTAVIALPGNRGLVLEKGGAVRVLLADGSLSPADALTLSVCTGSEMGLLGAAVDPAFNSNGFVYLYYTRSAGSCDVGTGRVNRVSRFTAGATSASLASEVVLFDVDRTPLFSGAAEQRSEPDVARLAEGVLMYLR